MSPSSESSTIDIVIIALLASSLIPRLEALSVSATPSTAPHTIRIGTRSSKLALTQTHKFQSDLLDSLKLNPGSQQIQIKIFPIGATGDQGSKTPTQELPLAVKGVDFTGALDDAILNGSVDVAVHSLKDIPPDCRWKVGGTEKCHLTIGAYMGPRETPTDTLITQSDSITSVQSLPHGAKVGSASIRRQAQLKALRPDLEVINIRGNVDARLKALENDEIDALILASSGLKRLGLLDNDGGNNKQSIMQYCFCSIPIETMLPGCGQGVIGITCRDDNADILSLLQGVDDNNVRIAATTERALLDTVQKLSPWVGRPPVAGYMRPSEEDSSLWLFNGLLATPDGAEVLRVQYELHNTSCNTGAADNLGRMAGEEIVKIAGGEFLDGYY